LILFCNLRLKNCWHGLLEIKLTTLDILVLSQVPMTSQPRRILQYIWLTQGLQESAQITFTLTEGAYLIFLQPGIEKLLAWGAGDWTHNLRHLSSQSGSYYPLLAWTYWVKGLLFSFQLWGKGCCYWRFIQCDIYIHYPNAEKPNPLAFLTLNFVALFYEYF